MDANGAAAPIRLKIPSKAEYLVFCRLVLAGLARARAIDEEALADLKLAVTEACANSIRHAYGDGVGDVDLVYRLAPDSVTVEVVDAGRGFAPEVLEADEGELREAGMGLSIIRAVMDEVELGAGPEGRGSWVRFTKYA